MVAERIVSHEEQSALCLAARAGDRAAADKLALAVWPWVKRKASQYGRRYRCESEELEAIGMARFMAAVKYYDAAGGTFLNYFASVAARAMQDAANRRMILDKHEYQDEGIALREQRIREFSPEHELVRTALDRLDPLSRYLVERYNGLDGENATMKQAASTVGITRRKALELHTKAIDRLKDELAGVGA